MVDRKLNDEMGRIAALRRYGVLDTGKEQAFERITNLVKAVLDVPICAVSLVDVDRQWFKSIQGLEASETPRQVAFCAHTIRTREALVVGDATKDPRFAENPLVTGEPHIRSYAGVPLETPDGYNLGSLCAIDRKPRDFTPAQIEILANFAALVIDELELRLIAQNDELTGTLTRRAFVEAANKELQRFRRYGRPATLIMLDVDHFKKVNDTYGHPAGDEVLKSAAQCCTAMLRPSDVIGRLGGEEFGIILPETHLAEAQICAERMRRGIAELDFSIPELKITASFGLTEVGEDATVESWSAAADAALYGAKRAGRNRCVVEPITSIKAAA